MNSDEFPKSDDTHFISFQDYAPGNANIGDPAEIDLGTPTHQRYNNFPNETRQDILDDLQTSPDQQRSTNENHNFWTFEYYQKYFNVDTDDVLLRIKQSMIPSGQDNYLVSQIRPNPDLYGPFWICVTLIFTLAISGNIANYFQTASNGKSHWKYEFHLVSYAATVICLYVWLLPIGLWGVMKWSNASNNSEMDVELIEAHKKLTLLELVCLYGYSLSIYIPVAYLWTIPVGWLQWTLVIVASILSGGVLIRSLIPLITMKQKPLYIAIILGMHLLLAAGFMLFFHAGKVVPNDNNNNNHNIITTTISTVSSSILKNVTESIIKSS